MEKEQAPAGCILSENDYISLSYVLALHLPEQADNIVNTQQSRITNPDRKREYAFISPSVSPHKEVRDSVFASLLIAENRRVEPWASIVLANLNNQLRQKEAIVYIRPALEEMQEIQRTGDIFSRQLGRVRCYPGIFRPKLELKSMHSSLLIRIIRRCWQIKYGNKPIIYIELNKNKLWDGFICCWEAFLKWAGL